MKRLMTLACLALALLLAATAFASGPRDLRGYNFVDGRHGRALTGEPVGFADAKLDTHVILLSDFQDAGGAPDNDGWTSIDLTQRTTAIWHVDTFNAANLDPLTVPNHAWWCGQNTFSTCLDGYGYGNGYTEWLDWWGNVPNPVAATSVVVAAQVNYDNEPGYDYLHLQRDSSTGMLTVQSWNGNGNVAVNESFSVPVGDYKNNPVGGAKAVHLRWSAQSDGGWSDQDCLWPTSGHSQIDLIRVTFNGAQVGAVETCEGPTQWFVGFPPGVGDFAKVWPRLDDSDPCSQNNTPQFAFIDDGSVVLGTGGTPCVSYCYGPGGYVVNPVGGLAGPEFYLNNEIWSPVFDYPAGHDGCRLEFNVYRHNLLDTEATDTGILYVWHVRSINDAAPSPVWTGWNDENFVYYGGPDYLRDWYVVTSRLAPGRTRMQVALGAFEIGYVWGYIGTDSSPGPYFDNVKVRAYAFGGPSMATRDIDIANDNFPATGILDYSNLGNNSVRFDMSRSIALPAELKNLPGDSIIVDAVAIRTGTTLTGPPQMVYKLKPNPLFNPYRTSGTPNQGVIVGDTTHTRTGVPVANRFDFDLPDENFFFPGDAIHYFFKATDSLGGTTFLPADTSGFALFPGDNGYKMLQYPAEWTVNALPSMRSATPGDQPKKLFWNDALEYGGQEEWMHAFYSCGYTEGNNLDVYYTNGPSSGVGNGLGGRAAALQLAGYDAILYSSGYLSAYTITGVDYANDAGDDVGVLDAWLKQGDKGLFLSGDDLVYNLNNTTGDAGPAMLAFENNWIQVNWVNRNVRPLIGNQSTPTVQRTPMASNPVFNNATRWVAYGSCPVINTFDAVTVQGSAVKIAEFTSPTCGTSAYTYAAAVYTPNIPYNAQVIYLPYDLMHVYEDTDCGGNPNDVYPVRAQILRDVMLKFGNPVSSPVVGVPDAPTFAAAMSPNPFNPITKISYTMPERGRLTVQVYDLRGRLVTTLHDGIVEAGTRDISWEAGSAVSSGVYFVQVRSPFGAETIKAALVK